MGPRRVKRQDGEWVPAAYSQDELLKPGMLCIRYNNYWCIRGSTRDPRRGQTGMEPDHAIFEEAAYGARAFFIVMRSYWNRHGLRTTRGEG